MNDSEKLFVEANNELRQMEDTNAIELGLSQLQEISPSQHEHLAILFDLAHDEIDDPSASKRYLSLEEIRQRQSADTTSLAKALQRFETVVRAPFKAPRLPTNTQKSATSYRKPVAQIATRVIAANPLSRLRAGAIDTILSLLLAAPLAAIIILCSTLLASEDEISMPFRDSIDYFPVAATYCKAVLLSLIFYPLVAGIRRGQTLGARIAHIKLVSANGHRATEKQILVRALLAPLNLLCAAPVLIGMGRTTLADFVSQTKVCQQ